MTRSREVFRHAPAAAVIGFLVGGAVPGDPVRMLCVVLLAMAALYALTTALEAATR